MKIVAKNVILSSSGMYSGIFREGNLYWEGAKGELGAEPFLIYIKTLHLNRSSVS